MAAIQPQLGSGPYLLDKIMARHDSQKVPSLGQLGKLHSAHPTLQDIFPFLQPRVAEQWQSAVCILLGILGSKLVFSIQWVCSKGVTLQLQSNMYKHVHAWQHSLVWVTLPC